jgi:chemotaxis protein CheX
MAEKDLKEPITQAVETVFDTLLGMEVTPLPKPPAATRHEVIGSIGLAGGITAAVCLRVRETDAPALARAMIGCGPRDPVSDEDVNDVIGELANIIAGKLKSCLRAKNGACNLSLPTITRGQRLDMESISAAHHYAFGFQSAVGPVVVEAYALDADLT